LSTPCLDWLKTSFIEKSESVKFIRSKTNNFLHSAFDSQFIGTTTDYTSDTESRGTGYSSTSVEDSEDTKSDAFFSKSTKQDRNCVSKRLVLLNDRCLSMRNRPRSSTLKHLSFSIYFLTNAFFSKKHIKITMRTGSVLFAT